MLLDVLLALWISFAIITGLYGGITLNKGEKITGLPGVILALVMFPIFGSVFIIFGAILAFPLLYWLVF